MPEQLFEINELHTYFYTEAGTVKAVDGVSFDIYKGEVLAIVGESGSGKSVSALSINRLIPNPPGEIVSGTIKYNGINLLDLSYEEMRKYRGQDIAMIFQEPMTSLNPVFSIGRQIGEAVRLHEKCSRKRAGTRAVDMLRLVGIPSPERRVNEYPHQLSGGMRQRAMIAMALACNPKLLIADEPTTALDVTIQAQILDLIRNLRQKTGSAVLLVTHDLGVVAEFAERVLVMYAGRKVEEAEVRDLFNNPRHPYTQGLLGAVPRLGSSMTKNARHKLTEIPGRVPDLTKPIDGCVFADRCPRAEEVCRRIDPALEIKAPRHFAACHFASKQDGVIDHES